MATLRDVIAYFCTHYPHKHDLSKARLTKMVYLADWKSALERNTQMTSIEWIFNHYGPYVDAVVDLARADSDFIVDTTRNFFGDIKEVIRVKPGVGYPSLTHEDKEILGFVIDTTESKRWNDFIRLIYSTYPVVTQARFSTLDLPQLAREYRRDAALFG